MLNGQRIRVRCNPSVATAGEILDAVLSQQDIKESYYFALALLNNGEFLILASDCKVHKMTNLDTSELHLRFKFFPKNGVDAFKDSRHKHQLYLELRRDVVEGRCYRLTDGQHLNMASMALQTEFGDFSEEIHGNEEYFLPEHYLPRHVIRKLGGPGAATKALTRLHRAQLGESQSKTELRFCRELQKMAIFGHHPFQVMDKKASNGRPRHIGIHLDGVCVFETSPVDSSEQHKKIASYPWEKISRIQYDKSRFQLSIQDGTKIKFHVSEVSRKL